MLLEQGCEELVVENTERAVGCDGCVVSLKIWRDNERGIYSPKFKSYPLYFPLFDSMKQPNRASLNILLET